MRITIALPAYWRMPIGGYHVHYHYANLLSRKGHDVTIVFPRHPRAADGPVAWLKTRLKTPPWALGLRLRNRPLISSFTLDDAVRVRLVRDLSGGALPAADILIATAWQTAEALADAPASRGRKVYIAYDYEHWMTAGPDIRARIERTYRQAFAIVATSGIVAETIRRCGGAPVAEIPCGLDFAAFGVDVPPERRGALHVGFPVRHETFKGAADAIAAATLLRERHGDRVQVAAFGSQPVDMPDWIAWHQYPSQPALRRFYNAQAVFMLPSHFEGWGLTGVEAMACGAALVTADNGGCRDYAIDGQTALVVPPRQPDMLAAAIDRLFADTDLRLRLAREGHAFVQKYTWAEAGDRLDGLLRRIAGSAP
jgi:glycosyltransferase involved in cell wall biosynthesis